MVPPASHKISRALWYSGYRLHSLLTSRTGLLPPLVWLSNHLLLAFTTRHVCPQPQISVDIWFGLFPVRSPLLRESCLLSFPPVTKMFQFTGFPSCSYVLAAWWQNFFCRVSPFGYPWIITCLQFPMAFRSLPRPSSALDAKAFTLCSSSLDRITFVMCLPSASFCFLKICSQLLYSKIVFFTLYLKVCFCFFFVFSLII